MKNRNSLRKAAVLISSLETAVADQLLDQMGPEQAARVRNAILYLGDVPVDEQEQVLAEFFGHQKPVASDDVELVVSSASKTAAAQTTIPSVAEVHPVAVVSEPQNRFAFLELAPGLELANYLEGEHPQIIAVVATQLSAEKAAELLRYFPAQLQDEVIDRLGAGADAEDEVLAEIESQLRHRFANLVRIAESSPRRRDHLQAILRHLKPAGKTAEAQTAFVSPPRSTLADEADPPDDFAASFNPSPFTLHSSNEVDFEFEELLSLSTVDFFAVFAEADSRLVMLALAGAPRRMFDRYVAQFSVERAEEFERHLEQLRPLTLRDVEAAQQELARIAGRRLGAAKPAAENSRKFAMAV